MSLIKPVSAADSGGHHSQKQKRQPLSEDAENEKKVNWKVSAGMSRSSSSLEQSVAQKTNRPPLFTNKSSRILPGRRKSIGRMSAPQDFYRVQAKLFQKLNTHREQLLRKEPHKGLSISSESISEVKKTKAAQEQNAQPKRKRQS